MITYHHANQVRLALKMRLSHYCWYSASHVETVNNNYIIVVDVKKINKYVRKQAPPSIHGVKIRLDLERSK